MSSAAPFAVNVIPPSPEAAALAKYADVPVNLYTGTPQITIPLYDVRERDLQVPVFLSYHGSGHKVEDEAPRVGLGWALNAGGLVTRSIRGLPDEYRPGGFLHQAATAGNVGKYQSGTAEERFQAFDAMARGCLSAEPDVYYFNFAGFSGRFQFDWDGSIVIASPIKFRITPIGLNASSDGFIQGWEIITPDGLRWVFDVRETTSSRFNAQEVIQNPCVAVLNHKRPPHTWHLAEASSYLSNSSIRFVYVDYFQTSQRWSVETQIHDQHLAPAIAHAEKLTSDTQGKYLSRIETSSGDTTVDLLPGPERTDVKGGPGLRALDSIRVTNRRGEVVKHWEFAYHYDLGRLGLHSVQELSGAEKQPPFRFGYYRGQLPNPLSTRQDHWGFYNNNPTQTLIPATVAVRASGFESLPGANRAAAPENATVGMLREITYPTGGSDIFEFEPHDYSFTQDVPLEAPVTKRRVLSGSAPLFETPAGEEYVESHPFTLTHEVEVVLNMFFTYRVRFGSGLFLPAVSIVEQSTGVKVFGMNPGGAADANGEPTHRNHTMVFNPDPFGGGTLGDLPPQRLPAGNYLFVVKCKKPSSPSVGGVNGVAAQLNWDAPTGELRTDVRQGGGVRIARTTRSFGLGHPSEVTTYEYKTTRNGAEISSGSLLESDYVYSQWLTCTVRTTQFVDFREPRFFRYSQNRSALGTTQGSHVGYSQVTVVHGANGENGKTVYSFTSPIDFPDSRSTKLPFPPATSFDFRRGLVTQQTDFAATSNTPVRRVVNEYAHSFRSIHALKVGWEIPAIGYLEGAGGGITGPGHLDRYAVQGYQNIVGHARLVRQETHLRHRRKRPAFVTQTAYEYQEDGHKQLTRERRSTNEGQLVTEYKYASDYPAGTDAALDELVNRHVANALIETVTFRDDGLGVLVVSARRNRYALYHDSRPRGQSHRHERARLAQVETASIEEPFLAEVPPFDAVADLYEPRQVFRAYDHNGNLLEQSEPGGMVTCYIWDSAGTQPLARVDNSMRSQVFYENFEDFPDGTTTTGLAYTGTRSMSIDGAYSLGPSQLPQLPGDYTLTYWQKIRKRPWTRVEKHIAGYVPGAQIATDPIDGHLDEVRLHPAGAHMTTFTHQPLRGIQSRSDINALPTSFEYDGFGRLSLVLDHDRHVRRHYEYALPDSDRGEVIRPGHVRTYTVLGGHLKTAEEVTKADHHDVARATDYVDGFARTIQKVRRRGSPGSRDVVEIVDYDAFSRRAFRYLPFTTEEDNGAFKASTRDLLFAFYASDDETVAKTMVPFAQTRFDDSPLDLVVEQGSPGEPWQPQEDAAKSHTRRFRYYANSAADKIPHWRVASFGAVAADEHYPSGALRVESVIDEDDIEYAAFYDLRGREVLRQTRAQDGQELRTYFVYDHKSSLAYVIPPRVAGQLPPVGRNASAQRPSAGNADRYAGTLSSQAVPPTRERLAPSAAPPRPRPPTVARLDAELLKAECYRYHTDHRHRLVERAAPGLEMTFLVYDRWDRLVLSQTGNQRLKQLWTYYKFDALDRLVLSGEAEIPGDRRHVAKLLNEFCSSDTTGECRFEVPGNNQGYSNRTFPVLDATATIDRAIYYDDYRFISDLPNPEHFAFKEELGIPHPLEARGQMTGERLRVLPSHQYVSKAIYYDRDYRPVQVTSDNHLGGTTRHSQTYTFTGQPLQSLYEHHHHGETTRVRQDHTYDHTQALTRVHHQVNDQKRIILYAQTFNDLGQVVRKGLYSSDDGTTFAQLLDFRYNIRGWLTSINRLPLPVSDDGGQLFALEQGYETQNESLGNVPQFNGNVSFATWMNAHFHEEQSYVYIYDAFNRLAAARYRAAGDKDGAYDTKGTYDANGNILTLNRHGLVDTKRVEIDRLTYSYQANELTHVEDASGRSEGFNDAGVVGDAYKYDLNGNLVSDGNKGIRITHNYQNRIEHVVSTAGESAQFGFDGAGRKCFRDLLAADGSSKLRRDYTSHCVFENGVLRLLMHDEGRLIRHGAEWTYQYHLLDPQGNVRVAFQVNPALPGRAPDHSPVVVLTTDYYPFGLSLIGNQHFDASESVRHLFNSKELQDVLKLDWYDFGERMLDPAVGRWTSIDPLTDKYPHITPYGFVFNNPTRYTDPDGRDPRNFIPQEGGGYLDPPGFNPATATREELANLPAGFSSARRSARLLRQTLRAPGVKPPVEGRLYDDISRALEQLESIGDATLERHLAVLDWQQPFAASIDRAEAFVNNYAEMVGDAYTALAGAAGSLSRGGYLIRRASAKPTKGGGGSANPKAGSAWEQELVAGYLTAGFEVRRHPGDVLVPYASGIRRPDLAIYYKGKLVEFIEAKGSLTAPYSKMHREMDAWIYENWEVITSVVRKEGK